MFENIDKKRAFFAILLGTAILFVLGMGLSAVFDGIALIRSLITSDPVGALAFAVVWIGLILYSYQSDRLLKREIKDVPPPPPVPAKKKRKVKTSAEVVAGTGDSPPA